MSPVSVSFAAKRRPTGAVVKHVGTVKYYSQPDTGAVDLAAKVQWIYYNNQLESLERARAYVKLVDGSKLLMRDKSRILLHDDRHLEVLSGKVIFSIAKCKRNQRPIKIATRVAMLGIRGTEFSVEFGNTPEDVQVYLQEGDITVEPAGDNFKLFRQKELSEFDAYKRRHQEEYTAFKKKEQEEFVGFVERYQMQAGKGISIRGQELREVDIPEPTLESFKDLNDSAFDQQVF